MFLVLSLPYTLNPSLPVRGPIQKIWISVSPHYNLSDTQGQSLGPSYVGSSRLGGSLSPVCAPRNSCTEVGSELLLPSLMASGKMAPYSRAPFSPGFTFTVLAARSWHSFILKVLSFLHPAAPCLSPFPFCPGSCSHTHTPDPQLRCPVLTSPDLL